MGMQPWYRRLELQHLYMAPWEYYGKLIAEWDALTPEDKEKLRNNLASIQLGELYNEIHRNWAGVCLKQKRTTEARRVLGKIGEVPAEEPERPASRRRRR